MVVESRIVDVRARTLACGGIGPMFVLRTSRLGGAARFFWGLEAEVLVDQHDVDPAGGMGALGDRPDIADALRGRAVDAAAGCAAGRVEVESGGVGGRDDVLHAVHRGGEIGRELVAAGEDDDVMRAEGKTAEVREVENHETHGTHKRKKGGVQWRGSPG